MSRGTKARIIEAALRKFSSQGYHQASMEGIAADAGVAKGTLYYNYPSKAQLFASVVAEGYQLIEQRVRREAGNASRTTDVIERILQEHLRVLANHADLARIMWGELSAGVDSEAQEAIAQAKDTYVGFLADTLAQGMEEGTVNCYPPRLMAFAVVAAAEGVFVEALKQKLDVGSERLRQDLTDMLLLGVFVRPNERGEATCSGVTP